MEREELGGGRDATQTQLTASWSYRGQQVSIKELDLQRAGLWKEWDKDLMCLTLRLLGAEVRMQSDESQSAV